MTRQMAEPATVPQNMGNRRELAFSLLFSALLLVGIAVTAMLLWYSTPQPEYRVIGTLDEFSPSSEPYWVVNGDFQLWVVNTGDKFLVFDAHSTRPGCFRLTYWKPDGITNEGRGRFEEPCHGAKYALTGASLEGLGPPARSLDSYEYDIRNGQFWVCFTCKIPGDPPPDG